MKQVFLITAYKDFKSLYELASYLAEYNYVYIHIDRKSKEIEEAEINKLNKITNCHAFSKYTINWGAFHHISAFLDLLKKSLENDKAGYIHCITGEDFPVMPLEEMEDFFLSSPNIYMEYIPQEMFTPAVNVRWHYYNWFPNKNVKNKFLWQIQDITVKLQKIFFIHRKKIGQFSEIYKGLIYCSMPREAAEYIVEYCDSHGEYLKGLQRCQVPEEFFFQTIFMNSIWKEKVINNNLRYMDWTKGDGSSPAYLDESDYETITNSKYVFARKFHSEKSAELKKKIMEKI